MLIMQRRNVPPNKQSSSIYKQSLGVSNGERLAGHKSCERLLNLLLSHQIGELLQHGRPKKSCSLPY